jgi:hypothetical protein
MNDRFSQQPRSNLPLQLVEGFRLNDAVDRPDGRFSFSNRSNPREKSGEFLVSRVRNSWEVLGMFRKTRFQINY